MKAIPNSAIRFWQRSSVKSHDILAFLEQRYPHPNAVNVELFARDNNVKENWISVGNELSNSTRIHQVFVPRRNIPPNFLTSR